MIIDGSRHFRLNSEPFTGLILIDKDFRETILPERGVLLFMQNC